MADSISETDLLMEMLENLECPFTWDMDDIDKSVDYDYQPNDDDDFFPIMTLMRNIMNIYVDVKAKEKEDGVLATLETCKSSLESIDDSDPEISQKVAAYLLEATKCFVFHEYGMHNKLNQAYDAIKDIKFTEPIDISTLFACRSMCWSKYHRIGTLEAESFIRKAIDKNPNCVLWHFILGKNLRRMRRDLTMKSLPGKEEIDCFIRAYKHSKNPVFGTFLAQMYREQKKLKQSLEIYEKVFLANPESNSIYLRLALGFIQLKKFERAKVCLNKVQDKCQDHSMYWHYRGILNMRLGMYQEAAKHLKKAADGNNLPAANSYLQCIVKVDKTFKVTEYLLSMVNQFSILPEYQIQSIVIELAFSYWLNDNNFSQAIKYFLHGIDIDPKSKVLQNYHYNVVPVKNKNVYRILQKDFLPKVKECNEKFDAGTLRDIEMIEKYCAENLKDCIKKPDKKDKDIKEIILEKETETSNKDIKEKIVENDTEALNKDMKEKIHVEEIEALNNNIGEKMLKEEMEASNKDMKGKILEEATSMVEELRV
ncbi:hypothetical protein TKK_0017419 [Trichogramma kaykai]|uniref:Cell division cycle protein 27 homolog n=1 Tax=Trichogramma kaykai TaxID=54128 RepID=A0ABD2W2S5_9HYME